jgi:hypothetical protein
MLAQPMDSRDVVQEKDHPVYRVYFWHEPDPD